MAVTSFNVDAKLDATLEDLKKHYSAASKAEILRKAVALLKIVKDHEQPDGSILLRSADHDLKVLVR